MPSTTLIPVSEYLSTSYRPDRDYVDGLVLERNLGEWDHSSLQMAVSGWFFIRRRELGIHVVPEQRVQVTPTRFRIPDVCVVVGPEPEEQILTRPPFLCIEVLSKDDTMKQTRQRVDDYLAFGVKNVWVLDPRKKRAYAFTESAMREIGGEGHLVTTGPDISIPLSEIFRS